MPAVRLSQAGRSDTIDQGNRILVENWLGNLSAITKSERTWLCHARSADMLQLTLP